MANRPGQGPQGRSRLVPEGWRPGAGARRRRSPGPGAGARRGRCRAHLVPGCRGWGPRPVGGRGAGARRGRPGGAHRILEP
jgi:hypothetical protein